ncbi:MAG: M28 family peptidase [Candidatus Lokiarchaeota archaeon]|nr:M28 family peptidase [Candidatus Lokiarchaeota archaeon]
MSFSGQNAYDFTERISIPRLIGSDGWIKARKMIKNEFKQYGYEIRTHEFKSSMFITNVLLRVLMIPLLTIIFLIVWGYFFFPWLSLILSIIVLCIIPLIGKYASSGTDYKEPKEGINSQNVFAELKSLNSKIHIVFMGHYDTKSQVLSIVQRVICYVLLFVGGITVCILSIIGSILKIFFITNPILSLIIFICGIITAIVSVLLMANAVQNKSPGSLDNGTAVATLLELSRVFKENPPENIDLTFLCTDAEEQGLLGASAFIQEFEEKYDKNNTYFINFEAPGAKKGKLGILTSFGMPKKQYTSKKLNELAIKAAEELKIEIKKQYWPIGLQADHNPVMNHGYKATMLGAMAMSVGVHTPNDNMENVSSEKLEEVGRICEKIIDLLDGELS